MPSKTAPMPTRFGLVALGALAMSLLPGDGPVAQEASEADKRVIEVCLADAMAGEGKALDCITVVSKPCLERPGGDTTAGMWPCMARSVLAWDELLNRDFQRLIAKWSNPADEAKIERLRKTQRAWIPFRDELCELHAAQFEGGTLAPLVYGSCLEQETALRVIDLQTFLNAN